MDVIVIGCGAAGIAALRKLHDAGLQVLGLEAADRIGGRIHSVEFGDKYIDIGAAWPHGKNGNIVYELANPLGLLDAPKPDDKWYLLSNGEVVSHDKANEILHVFNDELDKADKYSLGSISQCVRSAANTSEVLKKDPKLSRSFIEWFEKNSRLGGQDDPKRGKTLRGLVEYRVTDSDILYSWKGRGFKTILDILMNKYPDSTKEIPLNIVLNKEVDNIRWGSTQPGFDPTNPLVQVKCKDGSLYGAKSVIITMSVGVLKERHEHLFNPPLPLDKVNTIKNLEMCVLDKIYMEFEKPWWPNNPAKFALLWRDEDKVKFSEEEQWITEIYGFWTVEHQPNVLLAWINGKGAVMMEKVAESDVQAGVQKLLDLVFKSEFNVTPIKRIIRTKWATNRWARGAYAHRTVTLEENGGGAQTLAEPLYHNNKFPVVCFAGEATSHHRHTGVDGAVESGFREADRLIESFKEFQCK